MSSIGLQRSQSDKENFNMGDDQKKIIQRKLNQQNSLQPTFKDQTNLQARTEDGLNKDISRKLNAEKVKKNLNHDQQQMMYNGHMDNMKLRKSQSTQPQLLNNNNNNNNRNKHLLNLQKQKTVDLEHNLTQEFSQFHLGDNKIISKAEYKDQDNKDLVRFYSAEIMNHMKMKEPVTTPIHAMENHEIPVNLRAKMVDWMIEVLSSYKCSEQTFFMSVRIMDKYFAQSSKMFIACKYEEIYPMKLQVVYEKIAHKKLPIEVIKEKEAEILSVLNFELIGSTPYEYVMMVLYKSGLRDSLESKKNYDYLIKICIYLSKMILYDYDLVKDRQYSLLAGALIFVAFKIIEQIEANFKAEEQIRSVIKILNVKNDILIETAAKILTLAKSFDKQYPQLENLKKFNGFSLDEEKERN
ncbi:Cyclin-like protein [Pseudocohnilembus persalinus]|uniref:Cyclin-like protein n=1 Tax=Pseudocohnilembus persalinus TaxID=266149 RepID=A0A0V0R495_PSEPJ|nr:Cyclin-like protein [Pseudocohnilembus persalinus]|eukprot:KRX09298.1 Cyclin-like protein [Pseudocohnilembus persalinus]